MKLSFGGSKNKNSSKAQTVSTPNVPGYIQAPVTDYFGQVHDLSRGAQPQTFGPSALQTQAFGQAGALGSNPSMAQGADAVRQNMNYTPGTVTAGQLSSTDLQPYMDPYERGVVDSFMQDWAHGNEVGLNQIRARTGRGAYGGSRQGGAEGKVIGDNTRTLASTLAQLRSAGFQNAQDRAQSDIAGRYGADTFNVDRGLAGAQLRLGAGETLANLGLAGDASGRANLALMSDLGAQQREIAQQGDPAQARARWLAQMQALLGVSPSDMIGNTTNQTGSSKDRSLGFGLSGSFYGGG